jgi:uncharacterized protein YqjF (DUF2071 family)
MSDMALTKFTLKSPRHQQPSNMFSAATNQISGQKFPTPLIVIHVAAERGHFCVASVIQFRGNP